MLSNALLRTDAPAQDPAYERLATALVLDALDARGFKRQALQCDLVPRTVDRVIVGRAKTLLWVDFAHDDPTTYALELAAVDSISPGELVVCATANSRRSGIWGELLTTAALQRGASGILTDGAVRDLAQIRTLGFPVYSSHVSGYDSYNRQKVVAYDVRVEIGGVAVEPGDLVVVDCDGAAVIPASAIDDVVACAVEKASREDGFRAAVEGGMPLVAAYERFHVL